MTCCFSCSIPAADQALPFTFWCPVGFFADPPPFLGRFHHPLKTSPQNTTQTHPCRRTGFHTIFLSYILVTKLITLLATILAVQIQFHDDRSQACTIHAFHADFPGANASG